MSAADPGSIAIGHRLQGTQFAPAAGDVVPRSEGVRVSGKIAGTICIVCGAGMVSGKEVVSLILARGLRDAGWNPEFIAGRWGNGDFVRRLEGDGFRYELLRLGFISASLRPAPLLMTLDQIRYWPTLMRGYDRFIKAAAPRAVIHTNWHHMLLLLPFLDSRRDILWLHDLLPHTRRYAHMLAAISNKVRRVVCVSHAVARNVLLLGVPQSRVMVIHSGIPSSDAMPAPDGRPTLRLGIVGQIAPWKGHDDLLDALALLGPDRARVRLRIFGSGDPDYVAALKRRVAQLELNDQVDWCGFVENQADIFGSFDVCVMPSRCEESFGMSALEANGFGRPVIGSSRGGPAEIIENGETGIIVDAQRPEALAHAIATFVRSPGLAKSMGTAARRRSESSFSLGTFVGGFENVIEEVMA